MAKLVNTEFCLQRISRADSVKKLKEIAIDIDYDKWEKVDYTQDAEELQEVREAWVKRMKELESKK